LELVVAGDEVGFRIDLDDGAAAAVHDGSDQPFGGNAAGLLLRGRQPLLAQPVDAALEVPAGLRERLLAIHHAGAGGFPEPLDEVSRDLGHRRTLSSNVAVAARTPMLGGMGLLTGSLASRRLRR